MFRIEYNERPRPAERPRARFSDGSRSYYLYTPPAYAKYKQELIEFFNQYQDDQDLKELFDKKKLLYGLSVKVIFRFDVKKESDNPFYGMRPDIDNLFKAVVDSLFQSGVNRIQDGYEKDKTDQYVLDENGEKIPHFKQKIDDSRIVHTELLKLKATKESPQGFTLIVKNIGIEKVD